MKQTIDQTAAKLGGPKIGVASGTALAVGLGLGAIQSADAAVVYGSANTELDFAANNPFTFTDTLTWGAALEFTFGAMSGGTYQYSLTVAGVDTRVAANGSLADALSGGEPISQTSLSWAAAGTSLTMYDGTGSSVVGEWLWPADGSTYSAMLGLEANGMFGWMRVSLRRADLSQEMRDSAFVATVVDFAFQDCAGDAITAGATSGTGSYDGTTPAPLPGTLALLAAGALPLLAARRQRRRQTVS